MKRKKVLFWITCFISINTYPQDTDTADVSSQKSLLKEVTAGMIIKINPLATLIGHVILSSEYRLVFEVPVNEKRSSMLGISYLGKPLYWEGLAEALTLDTITRKRIANLDFTGFRFFLMPKNYIRSHLFTELFSSNAPYSGLYFGLILSYGVLKIAHWDPNLAITNNIQIIQFNTGVVMGLQIIALRHLSIDMYTGMGYKVNSIKITENGISRLFRPPHQNNLFIQYYFNPFKFYLGLNFGFALPQ